MDGVARGRADGGVGVGDAATLLKRRRHELIPVIVVCVYIYKCVYPHI